MSEKKQDRFVKEALVTENMLASAVGSGSVPVLATPMVAALLEGAAAQLAQQYVEEGFTTVGTKIAITHEAPSAVGARVWAEAVLEEQEGRLFRFTLQARDDAGVISTGTHERVAVRAASFPEKAKARLPR